MRRAANITLASFSHSVVMLLFVGQTEGQVEEETDEEEFAVQSDVRLFCPILLYCAKQFLWTSSRCDLLFSV